MQTDRDAHATARTRRTRAGCHTSHAGDERADLGLHPVRHVQENAVILVDGLSFAEQMLQHGVADVQRLSPLTDLRELGWVAEQHHIFGAGRNRERVGERDLSGLVDEQIVELTGQLLAREQPARSAGELIIVAVRTLRSCLPIR